MSELYGNMFIMNGELQPSALFAGSLVYEGESVYEVIRMVKGTPLFFNDHIERLSNSVMLQKRELLAGLATLRKDIIALTRSDRRKESNIKIVFNYNENTSRYLIYYLEPSYPTAQQYRDGVKGTLFHAERKVPESKVINHKLRSAISHKLLHEKAYEAILVNEEGDITEGSRSNIFFLKDNTLTTAPDNMILLGITRKHILEICRENGIVVNHQCVRFTDINLYDAVFMTGTSPMVLPFNSIDNISFNVSLPLMDNLRKLYMIRAEESLKFFRNE